MGLREIFAAEFDDAESPNNWRLLGTLPSACLAELSMHLLDLDSSAPRQFLDWLVELGIRLNVIIDVIDVMTLRVSRRLDA